MRRAPSHTGRQPSSANLQLRPGDITRDTA